MKDTAHPWSYSLARDADRRLPNLTLCAPFTEVTRRIVAEMSILCCHYSEVEGTGFSRPVYTVKVSPDLFDLFFNSASGYRAAYFRSPGAGLEANLEFMRAVAGALSKSALSENCGLSERRIVESLTTPSAKAWLAESGKEIDRKCSGCKGEWSSGTSGPPGQAEILNGVWETADGQDAEWGRKAPYLTKLRIMGAFVNDRLHELVPHDKRFRAYDINRFGWS